MFRKCRVALFLAVGICLLAPASGFGLDFSVGGKVGIGHNGYYGTSHAEYLTANSLSNAIFPRLTAGLFAVVSFSDLLAIQPELFLAFPGAKMDSATGWEKEKFTYLSLPVLLRLSFAVWKGQLQVLAGPTIMMFLSGGIWEDDTGTEWIYPRDVINAFLFSIIAGLAYQRPLPVGALTFNVRGEIGLSDTFTTNDHRFWNLAFLIGYVYQL